MFRRLPNSLPQDFTFPADLDKLGYYVNDNDQIRQKANPDQKYQYRINRNDRVNDVYKEAMNTASRKIVKQRLLDLGLEELRLPLGATEETKHVPILVSKNISLQRHVIVIFPERHTDPGVLSYRVIGDEGINIGSAINLVKSIFQGPPSKFNAQGDGNARVESEIPLPNPTDAPGLVIANPSQLIWYRGGKRAVTDREWLCLPRESAVHEPMRIDKVKNRVEGNNDFRQHIQYIFEHVLSANENRPTICNPEARFSIIGQEYVGSEAMQYISNNWAGWRNRISCVALVNPQHSLNQLFSNFDLTAAGDLVEQTQVTEFIAKRTRAYRLSLLPLESLLRGRQQLGCNIYSAGEKLYEESCFIRCWPSILDWIQMCYVSEAFEEPVFEAGASDDEEVQPIVQRSRKPPTEDEITEARFHGDMEVIEGGMVAKAS